MASAQLQLKIFPKNGGGFNFLWNNTDKLTGLEQSK